MRTVSGTITLPADAPVGTAARAAIRVRDVTYADLPAAVIGETVLAGLPVAPGAGVAFSFPIGDPDPGRLLNLDVHIDMDGSDSLTPGDLITTARVPVPATGPQTVLAVTLTRIG